jgi:protein-tyrosine-phosphatase
MAQNSLDALNVLFLCTGNSARSILAEALMNRLGAGKFRAFSAGSFPKGQVHPQALRLLAGLGYEIQGYRSKSWDEFSGPDAPRLDFIVTVCDNAANEVCPIWPGRPVTAHWGIPDPAVVEAPQSAVEQAFLDAYRTLEGGIGRLVLLPVESLASPGAQHELRAIGETMRGSDPA